MDINKVFEHYINCALWSSFDDEGQSFDYYDQSDISGISLNQMKNDVEDFCKSNAKLLHGISEEQIGHDFWLTRNHHGAGFWDRGLGKIGDELTKAAHIYGSQDVYLGDDGKLYII